MTEMIAAEPALAERCAARLMADGSAERLAGELRLAAASGGPVTIVGCGTSEHGAMGAAEIIDEAWRAAGLPGPGPVARQAFEASLDPQVGGLCIAISHDGATPATMAAAAAAARGGARTALITVSGDAPAAAGIDVVIETLERDQSYCHTVGYLSPLVAAAATGAALRGTPLGGAWLRALLAVGAAGILGWGTRTTTGGTGAAAAAEAIAANFVDVRTILTVASGADRVAARELTLKLEEGTWIPSAMRDLETFLHGHLPATDAGTGFVLILADRRALPARVARARQALEAAARIGIRSAAILVEDAAAALPRELTPAGRIVVPAATTAPTAPAVPAAVAALLASATALQTLTERLARARGVNPDPIRRDDPVYREAAVLVEG